MGELPAGGAMVAVQASETEALGSLVGIEDRVALAAVNSPSAVVLSGDEEAVLELEGMWSERGRKTGCGVSCFSFAADGWDAQGVRARRDAVRFCEPTIPVVSNLTGEAVGAQELCTPKYWVRHVRETVRFAGGVGWLHAHGVRSFLELGPDGVLSTMVHECLEGEERDGDGEVAGPVQGAGEREKMGDRWRGWYWPHGGAGFA